MTDVDYRGLDSLHLKGGFGINEISILTPSCADKISRLKDVSFGADEKKLRKNNHAIYYNEAFSIAIFDKISQTWEKISTKYPDDEKKRIEYFSMFMGLFLTTQAKNLSQNHALVGFCLNLMFQPHEMIGYKCFCNNAGAVSFIATRDYKGVSNDF